MKKSSQKTPENQLTTSPWRQYSQLLRALWRHLPTRRWRVPLVYGGLGVAQALWELDAVFLGLAVAALQQGEGFATVAGWILLIPIVNTLSWLLHGPLRLVERQMAFEISEEYRTELFRGVMHLPLRWHHDHHSGDTISRASKSAEALFQFSQGQFEYIQQMMKAMIGLGAFFFFDWRSGLLAVGLLLLMVWGLHWVDRPLQRAEHDHNEVWHRLVARFVDTVTNATTVITLRIGGRMYADFAGQVRAMWEPFCRKIFYNEWKWFWISSCASVAVAAVLLPEIWKIVHTPAQTLGVAGFVTLSGFAMRFTMTFFRLGGILNELLLRHIDYFSADDLWESVRALGQPDAAETGAGVQLEAVAKGETLRVSQLRFTHEPETDAHDLALRGLELPVGGRVALVGESGSGKSTLLRVLRGLYPQADLQGSIGQVAGVGPWLATHSTLIPQDPEIFSQTIAFNLTLGAPVGDALVAQCVELARFAPVLGRIPNGLAADIREKGVNLSGGERQRLALARGLVAAADSTVVLMDEPTSSVDLKNEGLIYENLFAAWPDKTFVVSLHRLSLLSHFDWVVELRDGGLHWQGPAAEYVY